MAIMGTTLAPSAEFASDILVDVGGFSGTVLDSDDTTVQLALNTLDAWGVALVADVDGFPDDLKNLTAGEITQLENINDTTISVGQWGYVGAMDQSLAQADSPTFNQVTVTTLTDGTISITGGNITAVTEITATTVSVGTIDNDGSEIAIGDDVQVTGLVGIGISPAMPFHLYESSASRNTQFDCFYIQANCSGGLPYGNVGSTGFGTGITFRGRTYQSSTIRDLARISYRLLDNATDSFGTAIVFENIESSTGSLVEHMMIDYTGNVGIGTDTPGAALEIVDVAAPQLELTGWARGFANNGNGALFLGGITSARGIISYDAASTGDLFIVNTFDNADGDIVFETRTHGTDVEVMRLKGDGEVIIETGPLSLNSHDITGVGEITAVTVSTQNLDNDGSALSVNDILLVTNAIYYTQVDGNEFIDSLNDGYMDYGATTAHRFNAPIRATTSLWWHAECVDAVNVSVGASGATWTDADADHLSGYQINANDEYLYATFCVHGDWDATSDLEIKVTFEIMVAGTLEGDTVDIKALCRYKGHGETATKTQSPETAVVVDDDAQYTMYVATIIVDHDLVDNVVDLGDKFSVRLNLETDTSEVDDILISHINFRYKTKQVLPEV